MSRALVVVAALAVLPAAACGSSGGSSGSGDGGTPDHGLVHGRRLHAVGHDGSRWHRSTFAVTNDGSEVTEFYVYAAGRHDGRRRAREHRPGASPASSASTSTPAPTSPPASRA